MAELGAAGSIVGCIGLAGQVAQGCQFIWEFAETVRDSPHLMTRLKEEIELTKNVSSSLEALIQSSRVSGLLSTTQTAVTALRSCARVVKELTELLATYKGKKFKNLRLALRQKKLKSLTDRLSVARSLISEAQNNMIVEQQQLDSSKSTTFQEQYTTNYTETTSAIDAIGQKLLATDKTLREIQGGSTIQSTQIDEVLKGNQSQSAALNDILATVCRGQQAVRGELGSIQETVSIALRRILQLQEEFSKGACSAGETKRDSPAYSPWPPKGESIMRVVDQQIIIRRNGKRELLACADEEFENASIGQKRIIVQVLLLSRLVAHLSTRYGNMLHRRYRKQPFEIEELSMKNAASTGLQFPVCSGVCGWISHNDGRRCSELKGKRAFLEKDFPGRVARLMQTVLAKYQLSRGSITCSFEAENTLKVEMARPEGYLVSSDNSPLKPRVNTVQHTLANLALDIWFFFLAVRTGKSTRDESACFLKVLLSAWSKGFHGLEQRPNACVIRVRL